MSNEGFFMDPKTAVLFFRACGLFKLTTREDRTAMLRAIVRRGKAKYIRDVDAVLSGKKVLQIHPKEPKRDH